MIHARPGESRNKHGTTTPTDCSPGRALYATAFPMRLAADSSSSWEARPSSSEPVTTVIHFWSDGGYRELSGALRSQELSMLALDHARRVADFDPDGCMVRIDHSMQPD
jgi:hypothetical protein